MCQPCSLAFIRARLSVRPKDVRVLNVHNSHLKKAFLNVPTREDLPRLLFYIMWISFLMSVFLLLHFRAEAPNLNWISQKKAWVFVLLCFFCSTVKVSGGSAVMKARLSPCTELPTHQRERSLCWNAGTISNLNAAESSESMLATYRLATSRHAASAAVLKAYWIAVFLRFFGKGEAAYLADIWCQSSD